MGIYLVLSPNCTKGIVRSSGHASDGLPNCDVEILGRVVDEFAVHDRQVGSAFHRRPPKFQFTRLLRGATRPDLILFDDLQFQFTRLLRGATTPPLDLVPIDCFNSRASCEARRKSPPRLRSASFQFTRLLRGATKERAKTWKQRCFNSRASCEARLRGVGAISAGTGFNSRASCEARRASRLCRFVGAVSIHAPLARRDVGKIEPFPTCKAFQFTRLLRGATSSYSKRLKPLVSIHAPLARRDQLQLKLYPYTKFQFTRLLRGATTSDY